MAYVFLNLGAFACVAVFRNRTRRTDVASLAGLGPRAPWVAGCFALFLVGLTGLPPTAGFVGKWAVFAPAFAGGSGLLFAVGVIAAANTVASLFYYLRPVRALFLDDAPDAAPLAPPVTGSERAYLVLLAAPVLLILPFLGRLGALCEAVAGAVL